MLTHLLLYLCTGIRSPFPPTHQTLEASKWSLLLHHKSKKIIKNKICKCVNVFAVQTTDLSPSHHQHTLEIIYNNQKRNVNNLHVLISFNRKTQVLVLISQYIVIFCECQHQYNISVSIFNGQIHSHHQRLISQKIYLYIITIYTCTLTIIIYIIYMYIYICVVE